eukprot:scaffold303574_cov30-Tisochrysis_lutea.AAC.1
MVIERFSPDGRPSPSVTTARGHLDGRAPCLGARERRCVCNVLIGRSGGATEREEGPSEGGGARSMTL